MLFPRLLCTGSEIKPLSVQQDKGPWQSSMVLQEVWESSREWGQPFWLAWRPQISPSPSASATPILFPPIPRLFGFLLPALSANVLPVPFLGCHVPHRGCPNHFTRMSQVGLPWCRECQFVHSVSVLAFHLLPVKGHFTALDLVSRTLM